MTRWLGLLLLLIAVTLSGGYAFVHTEWGKMRLLGVVESSLAEVGIEVRAGGMDLSFWPPNATLRDVEFNAKDIPGVELGGRLPFVRIVPDVAACLGLHPSLDLVEVDSPEIRLVVVPPSKKQARPNGGFDPNLVPVRRLRVSAASIAVREERRAIEGHLSGVDVEYDRVAQVGSKELAAATQARLAWKVERADVAVESSASLEGISSSGVLLVGDHSLRIEKAEIVRGSHRVALEGARDAGGEAHLSGHVETDLSEWASLYPPVTQVSSWPGEGGIGGRARAELELTLPGGAEAKPVFSAGVELEGARWGAYAVDRIEGRVRWKEGTLELDPLKVTSGQEGKGSPGTLTVRGTLRTVADSTDGRTPRRMEADVLLGAEALPRTAFVKWWPALGAIQAHDPVQARARFSGPLPQRGVPWDLEGSVEARAGYIELAREESRSLRLNDLAGSTKARIEDGRVELQDARLTAKGLDLVGRGRFEGGQLRAELSHAKVDLGSLSPIMGVQTAGELELGGVVAGRPGQWRFAGSVLASELVVNGRPVRKVSGDIRFEEPRLWAEEFVVEMPGTSVRMGGEMDIRETAFRAGISVDEGDLSDVVALAGLSPDLVQKFSGRAQGHVQVEGRLRPEVVVLSSGKLTVDAPMVAGEPFEAAGIQWVVRREVEGDAHLQNGVPSLPPERLPIDVKAFVRHRDGSIEVKGAIEPDLRVEGEWMVSSFPLERIWPSGGLPPWVTGRLQGLGSIGGTLNDPYVTGQIEAREVKVDGEAVGDSVVWLERTKERVHVVGSFFGEELSADGEVRLTDGLPFGLRAQMKDLGTQHVFNLLGPMTEFRGTLSGRMHIEGDLGRLDTWNGSVELASFEFINHGLLGRSTHALTIPLRGGVLDLDAYALETAGGNAVVRAKVSLPHRIDAEASGRISLSLLESIFPEIIAQADGLVDFNARLEGPLEREKLRLIVDAQVSKGRVSFREYPHPVEAVSARVEITENGFAFEDVKALMGGGVVEARGRIEMSHFHFGDISVSAELQRAQVRFPSWISATVNADLFLIGPVETSPLFTGDVQLLSALIAENLDWRQELLKVVDFRRRAAAPGYSEHAADEGIRYDIHVRGGVRVRNNLAHGDFTADLHVVGVEEYVNLLGEVKGTQGSFAFRSREFQIDRALILFNNPVRVDPEVEIYGTTVLENVPPPPGASPGSQTTATTPVEHDKIDVGVFFSARGHPFRSDPEAFKLQFSADRPYADQDLLSLIYFNRLSGEAIPSGAGNIELYAIILSQLTREIAQGPLRQFLGLESVDFNPAESRTGEQFLSLVVTKPLERGREVCPQDLKWRGLVNVRDPATESRIELDCRMLNNLSFDVYGLGPSTQSDPPVRLGAEMKIRFEFW
ncbi:MAG: translocation/assembly module TamB domain-containing protein [Nitrospirae bacterium]|nr:translocation/assembly module TamB domain-containing protein [Nitrospirota bacterium]